MSDHLIRLRNAIQADLIRYFDGTQVPNDVTIVATRADKSIAIPITEEDLQRSSGSEKRRARWAGIMAHTAAIQFERGGTV